MRSRFRHICSVAMLALLAASPAFAQQRTFASPDDAMVAFGDAIATNDEDALKALLGADFRTMIPAASEAIRLRFLAAWAKAHTIQPQGGAKAMVVVGDDGWTLPIPIVKIRESWRFDTAAGAEEMRVRRIGRNERATIQVMLAIYDAQKEYAAKDRNGDGVLQYAGRIASSPKRKDGLYWPAREGEEASPLGPAAAKSDYHGYRYRILTAQGKNAPGGAYDYLAHGRMIGGFAAIAWPVKYGDTGVMTFMVSHDGSVYEKDLGPGTPGKAAAVKRFDPDSSWRKDQPGS
jgi:hypothetical protein